MTIRNTATTWLKLNFPNETKSATRTSKFYPERELWFFTFPASYFENTKNETLNILCEHESDKNEFYLLKVPFSVFKENKSNFDIRRNGESFDLHISARNTEKFIEKRSKNKIDFKKYLQKSL
jgi:hypothetical protein